MSQIKRPIVLIAVLALAVVLGAAARYQTDGGESAAAPAEVPVLRVETLAVEARDAYEVERSFVGRVEAARESELGFELGGLLRRVLVEEGDRVAAGERLGVLDTERLRSRRDELRAARRQAVAQVELARATDARVTEAAELNAVSTQEWDEARQGLQAREAALAQLEAQIRSLEVEIAKSTLNAPFAGVVSARMADEGTVLPAGQPVLRLLEAERLEARIGVAAEEAAELAPGDELRVAIRGKDFTGRVKAILPEREARTRTVTVLVELPDAAGDARSGDLAKLELRRAMAGPGFWLPTTALAESLRGLWSCYVTEPADDGGQRVARRDVEVLHATTDRVFVRGALAAGEQVIVAGLHRVVPGQRVLAVEAPAAGPAAAGAAS